MNQHPSNRIFYSLSFSFRLCLWGWALCHCRGPCGERGKHVPHHTGHRWEAPRGHHSPTCQCPKPPAPLQESPPTHGPAGSSQSAKLLGRQRGIQLSSQLTAHLLHLTIAFRGGIYGTIKIQWRGIRFKVAAHSFLKQACKLTLAVAWDLFGGKSAAANCAGLHFILFIVALSFKSILSWDKLVAGKVAAE